MSGFALTEYADRDLLVMGLADRLASDLGQALNTHENVSFAVAGGTTPQPVLETLSGVHLDWARVTVLPSDERCVPDDHPRSNAGMIRQTLLRGPASAARFQPLWQQGAMCSAAVADLAPISVLLLGMGTDGHIASLFPFADGLAAALAHDAPPLVHLSPADQPEARVSLSAPLITGAIATHLLITGAEKKAVLENAAGRDPMQAPVRIIQEHATVHWSE